MIKDLDIIVEQFVDYLLPELNPYETSVYLFLLRNSYFQNGTDRIRIGKRTIASGCGKGSIPCGLSICVSSSPPGMRPSSRWHPGQQ